MKLSAIIIARNAEEQIADCLESVLFCDEIIVIDSGSTDKTVEIAKNYKALVFTCKTNDFSKLRNFGLEEAKGDWILYIDTDEKVTDLLRDNIKLQISNADKNVAAFRIKRKNFYLGNNEWPYIEKLERLFLKEHLKGWKGGLHESPIIKGKIEDVNGFLLHYTHRDLASMLAKTIKWSETEADLRFKLNHPKMAWWRFPRVMIGAFINSYVKQKGWKAGTVGLIESMFQMFSMFITYARLWEMQNKVKSQKSKIRSNDET